MIVAIHQPNYLPWLGYFSKMNKCDTFVFLDNVKFSKNSYTNRNQIKSPRGALWLTVPVQKPYGLIKDMTIVPSWDPAEHLKSMQMCYGGTKYFSSLYPSFLEIYEKPWTSLVQLNEKLISTICDIFKIKTKRINASSLNTKESSNELLIELCLKLNADTYLSGQGGKKYLNITKFEKEGISVVFHDFKYDCYPQKFGTFITNLSVIDYLFNVGSNLL